MFKKILDKLSISAKEAVIDGNHNSLDDFKNYLHVDRFADARLEEILLNAHNNSDSQLILISGNVGDGKSHMLARLFKQYPEIMRTVQIRNDATESNDVSKSWEDELKEFLKPFEDNEIKLATNKQIRIVAINLGVMSSFLDSCDGFSALKSFIVDKGIIDGKLSADTEHTNFQYMNLADSHLFTLNKDGAHSNIIIELLNKITLPETINPFYKSFNDYYSSHPSVDSCVLRYNYLELSKDNVKKNIADLTIYLIMRYKMIVSIRDILNFIYDLIVPNEYSNLTGDLIKEKIKVNEISICRKNLIYNKLFDSNGRSEILNRFNNLDPVKFRNKNLDNIIFKLSSTQHPSLIF